MKNFTFLFSVFIVFSCVSIQKISAKTITVISTNPGTSNDDSIEGDLYWALQQLEDGDIIEIDESLRGDTIRYSKSLLKNFSGRATILGNGICIINDNRSSGTNSFHLSNGDWEIADIIFGENCRLDAMNLNSLKVRRCVFEDVVNIEVDSWVATDEGEKYSIFESCRFSHKKEQYLSSPLTISNMGMNNIQQYLDIVSCTFTDFTEMGEAAVSSDGASIVISGSGYSVLGMELSPEPVVTIVNSVITDIPKSPYGYPVIKVTNRLQLLGHNLIDGRIVCDNKSETETDVVSEELGEILHLEKGEYSVLKEGKAYENFPANTTIDGITMPEKDILGNAIDYTQHTHSGASQAVYGYVAVEGIALNENNLTLDVEETFQLTVTFTPADATEQAVVWTSSNEETASVNEEGLVTAISEGTTIITAESVDGGYKAECAVTVNDLLSVAKEAFQNGTVYSRNGEFVFFGFEGYTFKVYTVSGQFVSEVYVESNEQTYHAGLSTGVYILKGYSDNRIVTLKVIVD